MKSISSPPRTTPGHADIILRPATDGTRRYTLNSSGEPPQISCATFADAVARAERFARAHGVAVWQTDDGHNYRQLVGGGVLRSV